jgi:DNA-binding response OmpR family regulator
VGILVKIKINTMANILVVDDSPELLEMIKIIFQLHNYEVRTAPTRSSLLAHLEIFMPDILLIDVLLDDSNGKDICKELKQNTGTKDIPIILLSGSHDQLRDYAAYGADDIIEKPFEFEDVEKKIKKLLDKNRFKKEVVVG